MLTELESEIARTGQGPLLFLEGLSHKPESLSVGLINKWRSGHTKNTPKDNWNAVMNGYSVLPSREQKPDPSGTGPAEPGLT